MAILLVINHIMDSVADARDRTTFLSPLTAKKIIILNGLKLFPNPPPPHPFSPSPNTDEKVSTFTSDACVFQTTLINTTIWTANHYDRLLIITLFYMSKAKHIYRFKLVPVSSHKIYAVLANLKMFGLTVVNLKSKIIMNMFLNSYYLLISTNQVSLTLLLTNLSKGYLNCLAPVFINVHKSHMLTAYTRKFENAVHVSS